LVDGVPELETRATPSRGIYSWKRMDVESLISRVRTSLCVCIARGEQGEISKL